MTELSIKYPRLHDYFDDLDEKYRELLKDSSDIIDSEKIKKLVG